MSKPISPLSQKRQLISELKTLGGVDKKQSLPDFLHPPIIPRRGPSRGAGPSYRLTSDPLIIDEGQFASFFLTTQGIPDGTTIPYTVMGITADDLSSGSLTGNFTVASGIANTTLTLANDNLTEGNEIITMSLVGITPLVYASVTVNDTSLDPPQVGFVFEPDYILIEYVFTDGDDLDTRTKMISPDIGGGYAGWGQPGQTTSIIEFGGDNTGTGSEAVLIRVGNYLASYPGTTMVVDCRAQWYGTVGNNPMILKATMWKGGTPVAGSYKWSNPTATDTLIVDSIGTQLTLASQDGASIGQQIGTFTFNPVTGTGSLIQPA